MKEHVERIDHLVIGGGIYGAQVASTLAGQYPNHSTVLVESEDDLLNRASTHNHGRLHFGYQYPLNRLTATQSKNNVSNFISDFSDCVDLAAVAYYGIHSESRVSPFEYEEFCRQTQLFNEPITGDESSIFGPSVVAGYRTEELTFSTTSLKDRIINMAVEAGVDIRTSVHAMSVEKHKGLVRTYFKGLPSIDANHVFNCTYAAINEINLNSGLPTIPSVHDRYVLFGVTLPEALSNISATVIYGNYGSIVANQQVGTHVLAHVEHSNTLRGRDFSPSGVLSEEEITVRYNRSIKDAIPYIPALYDATPSGEIVQVKSVFGLNPADGDRRVQTFPNHGGLEGYNIIVGGKMNSFYDASSFAVRTISEDRVSKTTYIG